MQALRTRPGIRRGNIIWLPAEDIAPNPVQPRKLFDEKALEELSQSIKSYGILNPLTVRCRGGKYEPAIITDFFADLISLNRSASKLPA